MIRPHTRTHTHTHAHTLTHIYIYIYVMMLCFKDTSSINKYLIFKYLYFTSILLKQIQINKHICTYICIYIIYMYIYVYICIYMYICIYICVYILYICINMYRYSLEILFYIIISLQIIYYVFHRYTDIQMLIPDDLVCRGVTSDDFRVIYDTFTRYLNDLYGGHLNVQSK